MEMASKGKVNLAFDDHEGQMAEGSEKNVIDGKSGSEEKTEQEVRNNRFLDCNVKVALIRSVQRSVNNGAAPSSFCLAASQCQLDLETFGGSI